MVGINIQSSYRKYRGINLFDDSEKERERENLPNIERSSILLRKGGRYVRRYIMDPIPLKIVEKTWKKMSTMSWQEITELTNLMRKQQPFVLAYLLAAGHEIFNQDEREQLLYLGVVIWQIMSQGSKPLTKITGDTLDGVEKANIEMLEYLAGESETDFMDTLRQVVNNYPQPEVLKYVVEALVEKPEEGSLIREEKKGYILIYLKTIIDCFSR
ncbi:hypothetical protein ES703_121669 [subsurface metagenome]